MEKIIIETDRLNLRKITYDDYNDMCEILQDIEVMHAWEKSFSDDEVKVWIDENLKRYENDGHSYYLAINKDDNNVVGVIGPLVDNIEGNKCIEIAYILNKKSWNRGYATEGALACLDYTFKNIDTEEVLAQIRPDNISSLNVAKRLNMKLDGSFIKEYNGKKTKHLIYKITKDDYKAN